MLLFVRSLAFENDVARNAVLDGEAELGLVEHVLLRLKPQKPLQAKISYCRESKPQSGVHQTYTEVDLDCLRQILFLEIVLGNRGHNEPFGYLAERLRFSLEISLHKRRQNFKHGSQGLLT